MLSGPLWSGSVHAEIPNERGAVFHAGYQPRVVGRKGETPRAALAGIQTCDDEPAVQVDDAQGVGAGEMPVDNGQQPAIVGNGNVSALSMD